MSTTTNETPGLEPEIEAGVDRRRMIRNVTIAAAAAAVGGAALSNQGAGATEGLAVLAGAANTETSPTSVVADTGYSGTTDGTGAFHVTNTPTATPATTVVTAGVSSIVAATGPGALDTAYYGHATGTGGVLDAPVALHLLDTSASVPNFALGTAGQFRQVAGALWYCARTDSGSTPALWLQLASPTGAGGFVAINPVRVYDSRQAIPGDGKISQTQSRVVSVADARNASGGAVVTANVVPTGAKAVAFNITLTETTGTFGYLSVVPGDATTASTSTVNWDGPGRTVANSGIVRVSPTRTVKVFCSDAASIGSTEFAIDVTGYYI